MRPVRVIVALACALLAFGTACDDGDRAPDSNPTAIPTRSADSPTTVPGIPSLTLPTPERLGMPGLTRATDSGPFDPEYASHYTLDPGDSGAGVEDAGFERGDAVTYYLLSGDGDAAESTVLLYIAEFSSARQAKAFADAEIALPRDDEPVVAEGSFAAHVGPIQPAGLPAGFSALHFEVKSSASTYSVAFAAGSRGRFALVVWARFDDDAEAQARLGSFAAALVEAVEAPDGEPPPGDETRARQGFVLVEFR